MMELSIHCLGNHCRNKVLIFFLYVRDKDRAVDLNNFNLISFFVFNISFWFPILEMSWFPITDISISNIFFGNIKLRVCNKVLTHNMKKLTSMRKYEKGLVLLLFLPNINKV
jgi:hypothetical protein